MTVMEAHKWFYSTFGIPFTKVLYPLYSELCGEAKIYLERFNDILTDKYDDYAESNMSIRDYITKKYGDEVVEKFRVYLLK